MIKLSQNGIQPGSAIDQNVRIVHNRQKFFQRPCMKSAKAIDKGALVNLYNIGGKDFLLKMIDNFMAKSPERIVSSRKSLETGDMKTIHLIAHSLKASSANIGAVKVQEVSERLEEMASIGMRETMGEGLEMLDAVLKEAIHSLQSERENWGHENLSH